jgi:hypothetical protein
MTAPRGTFITGGAARDKVVHAGVSLPAGWSNDEVARASDFNDIKDHCSAWINIMSYAGGAAIGDGSSDTTAAMNAAIAKAQSGVTYDSLYPKGGATIHLPPGRFKFASSISADLTATRIVGAGKGATVLDFSTAPGTNPGIQAIRNGGADFLPEFHLKDLTILGKSTADGLKITNGYQCKVENVNVYVADNGVHINKGHYIHLIGVNAHACTTACFYAHGTIGAAVDLQYVYATGCRAISGTSHGWIFRNVVDMDLANVYASGCGGRGFFFDKQDSESLEAINVVTGYADQNLQEGWYVHGAAYSSFVGAWSSNTGTTQVKSGFLFDACDTLTVASCKSFGNRSNGFEILNCSNAEIGPVIASANYTAGVMMAGCSNVALTGIVCGHQNNAVSGLPHAAGVQIGTSYGISLGVIEVAKLQSGGAKILIDDLSHVRTPTVPSSAVASQRIPIVQKNKTNNVAFSVLTVGVPNPTGLISAQVVISYAINSSQTQRVITGQARFAVARLNNSATQVSSIDAPMAQVTFLAGGSETLTATFDFSSVSGGNTVEQTFSVRATINSGSSGTGYIKGTAELVGGEGLCSDLVDYGANPYIRIF